MQNLEKILKKLEKKAEGRGVLSHILKELEVDFDDSSLKFYHDYLVANQLVSSNMSGGKMELVITEKGKSWLQGLHSNAKNTRDKFRDEIDIERTKFEVEELRKAVTINKKQLQGFRELELVYIRRMKNLRLMTWMALVLSALALFICLIQMLT
ncbi:MAG: hypothetical protein KDC80_21945 [Saprospiraceae bacterium]|nr:hypothetical protein [Saprospiraceae bacterium]